ncbi:related to E. coli elongation factor-type GTP-binding protein lepa [Cephalotrichum gorgonifer]|uniref:Related to E. coli elongation factor-type GTP-binding protein lepa n=1 Tax=Cephalotrichum gorgonifer TaxID=2041049 RepID=A0AAE8N6H7_9PEZI|nr:related to E. coli elongation factor-type GTP-binding protein lepa [Cephalotrichum gorgonifer]
MAPESTAQGHSHSQARSQGSRQGSGAGDRSHSRGKPSKSSQKAMLSKALQKANTAVQLDNAHNFEGARLCYLDACDLLQQVLQKTASEEDQRKLEAIRKTYTSRIEELDQLAYEEFTDDKALPARPRTGSYHSSSGGSLQPADDLADVAVIETAILTSLVYNGNSQPSRSAPPPPLQDENNRIVNIEPTAPPTLQYEPRGESEPIFQQIQPNPAEDNGSDLARDQRNSFPGPVSAGDGGHTRGLSLETNSWLDSKADSGGSASSSVHSRTSSLGIRRKHIRPRSGDTEAEFDAALDAAVEAAYDDGYEPADSDEEHAATVANALMKVELAKERVRESERETMRLNQERDAQQTTYRQRQAALPEYFYNDASSDEEERLLEEMTRGYEIEDFAFSQRSALDENGEMAGPELGMYNSSALTAKERDDIWDSRNGLSSRSANLRHTETPPTQQAASKSGSDSEDVFLPGPDQRPTPGVRSRRISGQNHKNLKIETSKLGRLHYRDPIREEDGTEYDARSDGSSGRVAESLERLSGGSPTDLDGRGPPGSHSADDEDNRGLDTSESPLARSLLAKNYSSSSLRSARSTRSRNMSLSNLDDISDVSPGTPSSNPFGSSSRLPLYSASSTPLAATFDDQLSPDPAESLYLFDGQLHGVASPGSPHSDWGGGPVELEPCPSDFLLRPFWLMRCLYQTIAHPRGGYISNRVFVPQDVWKVKGVKLRNVEDKMAACDYLTASLLKLGQVDTFDADAVLEEMQNLEGVLEQMSANLSRKLGSEVGVQSPNVLFKDSSNGADPELPPTSVPRSASVAGKSAAPFSWRRLRAKNSNAGLAASYNGNGRSGENEIESPSLESLPMTLHPTSRPPKRVLGLAQFSGPHAGYMESLARLFDAAQTIDQIARQVEDPGLRHADKTQVGLELCTRHASEFFAFYDKLDVERERGITVKAQTCSMLYNYKGEDYLLHLVDTPGHVDFRAEVTRSYASCGGALLLVDASQGIQAQTVSNFHLAFAQDLALVPVVNKIDMSSADLPRVLDQIESTFELDPSSAVLVSAKTGKNVLSLLPTIVERIPHPVGDIKAPLRLLLVDSWYDTFRGVICLVRVFDGQVKAGDHVVSLGTDQTYTVGEVGIQYPNAVPMKVLRAGQVGYIHFSPGMKRLQDAKLGDTFTHVGSEGSVEPYPGFVEPQPMVFVAAFPVDQGDYHKLEESIDRLALNDRSITLQKDHSEALGAGWRLGFLGTLHCSVFQDRLKQEHGANVVITDPTVPTKIRWHDGTEIVIKNPADFPDSGELKLKGATLFEPYVTVTITTPEEYLGRVIELCEANRGVQKDLEFFHTTQVILKYDLPSAQLVDDFFGKLKGATKGYATLDYEDGGWHPGKLVKLQLLVNKVPVDAICRVVHVSQVTRLARQWATGFKEHVDRQMFEVVIQVTAAGKIIARETIKPFRKDVLAKLHAADITRHKKLLEKQKRGRKRLQAVGNVVIDHSAFQKFLTKKQ